MHMQQLSCLLLAWAAATHGTSNAQVESSRPSVVAGKKASNPALLYWQAIALLPEVSAQQSRLMSDVLEQKASATGEAAQALLGGAGRSLGRFVLASRSPVPCDWGTSFEEGPFAPMPHLPRMHLLCQLALMKAAALFEVNQHGEALLLLLSVHRAARHVASDALLVTLISQHSIEQQAVRLAARHVLEFDSSQRLEHLRALEALPPLTGLGEALTGEHSLAEWLRHWVLGIQNNPGSEQALLDSARSLLGSRNPAASPAQTADAKEALKQLDEWQRLAKQARAAQDRLEAAVLKPWTEFLADMQLVRHDFAEADDALRRTFPHVEGAMRKQCESATLTTMLKLALQAGATLPDGETPQAKDAFEGRPLRVLREGSELVIQAQPEIRGRQLSLRLSLP